jgi:hypothetical protein
MEPQTYNPNIKPVTATGEALAPTLPRPRPAFLPIAHKSKSPKIFQTGQPVYSAPTKPTPPARSLRAAVTPQYRQPETLGAATTMGIKDAALSLKQTALGGLSLISGPWNSEFEQKRKAIEVDRKALNTARNSYYGGDGASGFMNEAVARLPGNIIKTGPELLNPSKKIRAINALYHGGRAYLNSKDPVKAVIAGGANILGEKAESLMGNLPGNVGGVLLEKLSGKAAETVSGAVAENTSNFLASTLQPRKAP